MENSRADRIISAAGLAVLAAIFMSWILHSSYPLYAYIAAAVSVTLFACVCLRFVPGLTRFCSRGEETPVLSREEDIPMHQVFPMFFLSDLAVILVIYVIRTLEGYSAAPSDYLEFWRCTDSLHYLDISRDWYLSEGSIDRLVQLVFLPGYPVAVRAFNAFIGNDIISGLTVSALSFSVSGCVLYKLLRLDMSVDDTLRCIKYLLISPAVFFFAAPMSESLFFLLSVSCIYLARKRQWLLSCVMGGLASFTRSLGLMLVVPVLMEFVHYCVNGKAKPWKALNIFFIPLGFAAYCYVNYLVAGDPFKFMQYQSEHWGQHLGCFFNTAAYQTKYALESIGTDRVNLLGLWLPNLVSTFAALVFTCLAAKKLRPSYTAYFIAYYVIAIGATWLLSAPRYLLVMPVIPMAMAGLSRSRRADILLTSLSILCMAGYMTVFSLRWQVW